MATATHVSGLLHARAEATPDKPFLSCRGNQYTYGEMATVTDRVAAGLQVRGVGKGRVVAVLSAGRPEYVEFFLACARLGAIEVPLNAFLKGEFLRYQLDNSQAAAIAVDGPGYESLAPLLPALPDLWTVICFDPPTGGPTVDDRRVVPYGDLVASAAPLSPPEIGSDDLLSLLYTSGTTGFPKGCMIPHGYALRLSTQSAHVLEITPDDYVYALGPLFHASGQMGGVATPLLVGHRVAIEPEFSASVFAPRIAELGVTAVTGVGAHAPLILAQPRVAAERQHQVRAMFFAPCPKPAREELAERYGVKVTAMLYGQTECVPVSYSPLSDEANTTNIKSRGRPAPDLELQIVDDDGKPVPTGEAGEIVVKPKGPYALFTGYWRNPEATEKAFAGGWYHTGDAGIIEDDGSLTFMDRKKDVIRRRGENISSLEVEGAILAFPKIVDVAVYAVPSEMLEDEVMATVRLAEGEETTPEELFAFFRANLPYFAIPRYIDTSGNITRNALNRVMKSQLKERGVTESTWDFNVLGLVVARSERRGSS